MHDGPIADLLNLEH